MYVKTGHLKVNV